MAWGKRTGLPLLNYLRALDKFDFAKALRDIQAYRDAYGEDVPKHAETLGTNRPPHRRQKEATQCHHTWLHMPTKLGKV
jgi:hypothetical protein